MAEEDKCDVCDNGDSRISNQILYCDGKDCDMPVHQLCYGVPNIPENDWYCERCKALRFHKRVEVVCCPQQTGAMKRAAHPGEFMHIVCAAYNKDVQHEREPYHYNKSHLNAQRCSICEKLQGLCIQCEYPGCTTYFHVQCGVNQGLIHVGYPMPIHNRVYCIQHMHAIEGNATTDPIIPAKRSASPTPVNSPPKQFKESKFGVGKSNGSNGNSSMTEMSDQFVKGRSLADTNGSTEPKRPKLAIINKPPTTQKQKQLSQSLIKQPRPTSTNITSNTAASGPASTMSISAPPTPKMITLPPKPPKPSIPAPTATPSISLTPTASRITEDTLRQTEINYLTARLEDTKKDLKKAQEKANEVKSVEKRLQEAQQQVERMRKEMQQQKDFKRAVTDIFMALNIRIANNTAPSPHKMDEYVRLLRDTLNRTGPPSENEWIQIVNLSNKLAMEKRK